MSDVLAAVVGALIGGAITYRVTLRQIKASREEAEQARAEARQAEAQALEETREHEREERVRDAARVALRAVADVITSADELPSAWTEIKGVTTVNWGPDDAQSTTHVPPVWIAQQRAAESAIEGMRAVGTGVALELQPVGLHDRVWHVARLVDDYSSLDGHAAQKDFTEYAGYVYRSLVAFLMGEPVPAETEPPVLDGTWQAPTD